jgi:hypothetical protein
MKFASLLTALSFTFNSYYLHASEPDPQKIALPKVELPAGEADIGAAISPMPKGIRAPFTGLLLSPRAVATLIAELSSYQELLEIETKRIRQEYEADIEYRLSKLKIGHEADVSILKARLESSNLMIADLGNQLQHEIDNRPNLFLWVSLGAAGGIALTLLTLFATAQVSN